MIVAAALAVGVTVWVAVPAPPRRRLRRVFPGDQASRQLDRGWLVAGVVVAAATVVVGWPWGTVAAVLAAPLVRSQVLRRSDAAEERRAAEVRRHLPGALDLVAAALEAGRTPASALTLVAAACPDPAGAELGVVAARLATAGDPHDVWRDLATHRALAPVGRAVLRSSASGTAPAGVVTGVADDLRRRRHAELARRSRGVGVGTAAPLGACFLPAFFLVGIVPTLIGLVGTVLP